MKRVIEVYFSAEGNAGGKQGCEYARLADRHDIHEGAVTHEEVLHQLLVSLKAHGLSGNRDDYDVQFGSIVDGVFVSAS